MDEDRWLRVALPAGRQGVLTQPAVLTLTSNPTSTSPVKRGKWILESLLGDPPPPAPPNVPALEATQKEHEKLSLRQALELHRINPSCASCHRVMDPLGLGFENFDAIGQWRERDGEHAIDPAGELPDGRKFSNSTELVELLQSRQPEIMRHFAQKLLTYALGRGLEPYDNCAVDTIVARRRGGRLSPVNVCTSHRNQRTVQPTSERDSCRRQFNPWEKITDERQENLPATDFAPHGTARCDRLTRTSTARLDDQATGARQ